MPKATAASFGSAAVLGAAVAVALATPAVAAMEPLWLMAASVALVVARIAWQDLADLTIPDGAVIALALLGAVFRLGDAVLLDEPLAPTLLVIALDVAISGGLLLAVREVYYRRRGYDGLGFGDVKLAAAGGALAGTAGFAWALLGASLLGLVLVFLLRGRVFAGRPPAPEAHKLPFGAVLAPALWVAWLVGEITLGRGFTP